MKIHFGNEHWHQAASYALRYEVFVLEQRILLQAEFDQLDTKERYYLNAYEQQQIIGTVRYQQKDIHTIQPDRFCIKKAYHGQGIGTLLLQKLEAQALLDGYRYSELSAEQHAVPFYIKLGYKVTSEEYVEDGVICVTMAKKLVS